ncbi:DUF4352 domain-containing protein [Planotetraspora kaengkrachanensis]|uniref:DUF4352 domain-containing protein n=1 Tax=Planotetraspora kaengkrachanensis TaxID=575193 RepID=A0A8J3M5W3_9ACTN|nr:DUF4352 domain-containing protein [Planotetraspora kaengkrachanensis]GIG80034.1 hypothetical protein Pka01_31610 [Planotetraspora kaengkrachanensis]
MHDNPQNQAPYGYAQPYPQTVIVQKKGGGCLKALLIGAAVLVVLVVVAVLVGGGDSGSGVGSTSASAPQRETSQEDPAKTAGVGDLVKDGKFSFKVTKMEKGLSKVGQGFAASKAQGQYVMIHLTVTNIGDEAQMFTDSAQKLIDDKGREYDADSGAAILLDDSNAFLTNINPGNTVKGFVLFDVPKNTKLTAIQLHDSVFSGGVTVNLS